jgi:hypothetical protein
MSTRLTTAQRELNELLERQFGSIPKKDGIQMDVVDIAQHLGQSTAKQRGDAYKKAYDHVVDYNSTAGIKIKSVLGRLSQKRMNQAIEEANETLKDSGLPQFQMMARFDAQGNVSFEKDLNFIQLDYIKRALGSLGGAKDSIGQFTPEARRFQSQARDLKTAMVGSNPSYGNALDIASDKISLENALVAGQNVLKKKVTPRDFARDLQGASASEKRMARLGFKDAIDTRIGDVKKLFGNTELDEVQVKSLWKGLSDNNTRSKISLLLSKGEADKLFKQLDQLEIAINLRTALSANSLTSQRLAIKEATEERTAPGVIQGALSGEIPKAGKKLVAGLTGATQDMPKQRTKTIFKEIANAMVNIQGNEARKALQSIYDAIKRGENIQQNLERASDIIVNNITTFTIGGTTTTRELNQE